MASLQPSSNDSEPPQISLVGCYTRYSTWTARVVAILEYYDIPYTATYFNLSPEARIELKKLSPTGLVPVLIDHTLSAEIRINDSLAISEYVAETHPSLPLWPKDPQLRALARSAAAEMHAGFSAIRNEFSANFLAAYRGSIPISPQALREIERMLSLWGESRKVSAKRLGELGEEDAGFLFGAFSIADAFFWPVLWRFRSYGLPLGSAGPEAIEWMKKMWSDPVIKRMSKDAFRQAGDPATRIEQYEDVFEGRDGITRGDFNEDWEHVVAC